jgi:uncharacterized protein YndB with AHSA1/START domain
MIISGTHLHRGSFPDHAPGENMNEALLVRREVQIAAPPATVFAFLTDPDKILSWMGRRGDD